MASELASADWEPLRQCVILINIFSSLDQFLMMGKMGRYEYRDLAKSWLGKTQLAHTFCVHTQLPIHMHRLPT
ncbi:hypothetical protein GQ55_3G409500 [Panicum hallii var. hallii]|uniref:Uncharacterized protein n=2 Tax=Panicum hallii TaxID=206008 RepID=A0A2T7EH47_9POAL|nr:hypothetical protein GQ55_3G409500 [Panicum hallii var. hallii]PVH62928.1 hypothetical protein PAHAL_3G431400 [Panicum hallii]